MLKINDKQRQELEKKHYEIVGNHGAVQICEWTKKSLRNQGNCYKHKFYGAETFSCAQMTPLSVWCDQNCIFCWRPAELMLKKAITETVDDPKKIIEDTIIKKRKLLMGFKGNKKANQKKVDIALNEFPSHWAISLSGEPTLYPKLCELVKELKTHKEVKTIFIVTNGQHPEKIKEMIKKDCLPTQLYISLDASTIEEYDKINRGINKDAWQRLNNTLELIKDLPTRTVVRLTLIKGLNTDKNSLKRFAEMIEKSQTDFLEIKSYMWIGYSRERLKQENMPTHDEIKEYTKTLLKYLPSFKYEDEQISSRIILLKNIGNNRTKPVPNRFIIKPENWRF